MKIVNRQITDEELNDLGLVSWPELIVTDEVLADLEKKGVNVR